MNKNSAYETVTQLPSVKIQKFDHFNTTSDHFTQEFDHFNTCEAQTKMLI